MTKTSNLTGDDIVAENANWSFSGEVAKKFDQHVEKSVPFYHEGHDLVAKLSDFFLSNGSTAYEIGSSTGKLTSLLAERNKNKKVDFIGIDREADMVEVARAKCAAQPNIAFVCDDLMNIQFAPSDMITSYYTIQFVHPKNRQVLINRIYESLNWGGAFVWFEKVRAADARFQDITTALYTDYKLAQGYSPNEIVAKARSLKGVLEPFSTQGNNDLLTRAGFKDVISVFKYVCFEGYLAIK
jgi:tRNA (cmo5U34)-methyltransferase